MTMTENAASTNNDGAKLPLFYTNPTPLDSKKHQKLGLIKNFGLGFTKKVNAVPINLVEFPQISMFYPIAFSPDEQATPVAVLGVREQENLFLNDKDEWAEKTYIPAYIRRYPFIFSEIPGGDQLTLCVDDTKGVVKEGTDAPFFDKDGKPSELANNALEFCKSYHASAQQTIAFSNKLVELDLLVTRTAELSLPDGGKVNFSGFRIIDEEKLKKLDDKKFLELRESGYLPHMYAHLLSGGQWQRITNMLQTRMGSKK